MPFTYRQVSDVYNQLKDAGVDAGTLPQFSSQLDQSTGTDDFSAGLNDNFVKRASVGLDRLLEATGLPSLTGSLGRAAGNLVGAGDTGEEIGRGLPRMAVNFAPLLAGGLGLPAVAALTGAETYTATGSPAAGLISGATNVLLPGVAGVGERAVLRGLGTKMLEGPIADAAGNVVGRAQKFFPNPFQSVASFLGGQAAAAGTSEVSSFVQDRFTGQPYDFNPKSALLNMTLGQLPFAAMHLAGKVVGHTADPITYDKLSQSLETSRVAIDRKTQADAGSVTSPVEKLPNIVADISPTQQAQINQQLASIRGEKAKLNDLSEPNTPDRLSELEALERDAIAQSDKTGVLGEALAQDSTRMTVTGTEHFDRPETNYRIIKVADTPENAALGFKPGQLIGYSTRFEPGVEASKTVPGAKDFSIPERFHDPNVVDNKLVNEAVATKTLEQNPDLPVQTNSGLDRFREEAADFSRVRDAMDNVQEGDTEALRVAINNYNGMLSKWGYKTIDDNAIKRLMIAKGVNNPKDAVVGHMNDQLGSTSIKAKAQQDRMMALVTELEPLERARKGEENVDVTRAQQILDMYKYIEESGRGGRGLFEKTLLDWKKAGEPGGIEGLRSRVIQTKEKGGIAKPKTVKPTETVTKTEDAAKAQVPETAQVRNLRRTVAETVSEVSDQESPDIVSDAIDFRDAYENADFSDKDFFNLPHVREWKADADSELARQTRKASPDSKPQFSGSVWTPQTDVEKFRYNQISPDEGGTGLARFLATGAVDPKVRALAQDLQARFPEALKRIFVTIERMAGHGYAQRGGNREAQVVLSHGTLLSNDPVHKEEVMMHELLHGLTVQELANPTKVALVKELNDFRQRLVEKLPSKIRSAYEGAVASNWMYRWVNDKANMKELGPGWQWQQVVYGLLNNDELVAQGFSSEPMRQYMQALRVPGTPPGNFFTRWVKKILGFGERVTDNEFSRFMDITSRVLDRSEAISDFSNFTDQWFAGRGYAPGIIRDYSRLALDVVQGSAKGYNQDLAFAVLNAEPPINVSTWKKYQDMQNLWKENGDDAKAAKAVLGELNYPPDYLDNLLTAHLSGDVPTMSDAMALLPDRVTDYLFSRAQEFRDVMGAVQASVHAKNEGLINIVDPKALKRGIDLTITSIDKFLKQQALFDGYRVQLAQMSRIAPDAYFDNIMRAPAAPSTEEKGIMDAVGGAIGLVGRPLANFLEQPSQIARSNPVFGEWYSKAMLLPAMVRRMTSDAMAIFGRAIRPDGSLGSENTKDELNKMYAALHQPELRTALDKLIYLKQERGGNAVKQLSYDDPAVKSIMAGLSEKQKADLKTLDTKVRLSKVAMDQQTLQAMKDAFSTLGARLVMKDMGMRLKDATSLSSAAFDAVNANFSNPQEAAQANGALASIASKLTPDAYLNLLKFTQDSVEQHKTYATYLANNPDWVSAVRNGAFTFNYVKNGKTVFASAENMKEAKQRAGGREILNWKRNERDPDSMQFLGKNAADIIPRLRELEANQFAMLRPVMSPEDLAAMQRTSPVAQFERDVNASQRGTNLELEGRTLSRGADELPWFENHIDWIGKNASYWQRRLLRTQGESMLLEPGTEGTETAGLIKQHMENLFSKDPQLGRAIQQVTSTWQLGFNMASRIAYTTQPFMRGVGELVSLGAGPIKAFRTMTRTWSDYFGHKFSDKPYQTGEEEKFIKDAMGEGQIDAAIFDSNEAALASSSVNFKRVLGKDKPKDFGQYLSSAAGAYQTAGMWVFRMGERLNNEVTLLSAFRTLREQNPEMPYDEAKRQAYLVNSAVNDVGGRANRPIGLFSGKGDVAQTAAMTMVSLQSYMLGNTFQIIRHLKNGFFRPEGITPAEVYAARKAAIYQLGVQFAAAGTLGMPFVAGSLALLNQAFPELEINKHLRESVADLFGSDSEDGHILTDMALTGVPSMMGWDFSSRLSSGNVLPGVSEYNGFQPEQILGMPFANVTNFVKGGIKLAQGDTSGGYAFVPPGIRKLTQLAMNGGQLNDFKSRPLFTPTNGEALGVALGFNPTALSNFNVANRMALQSEAQETRRQGQFHQKLAEQALAGNLGDVRQALIQHREEEPGYNVATGIQAIARAAEEMTFPKDLRRQGGPANAVARSRLLQTFSLNPSLASEVSRLEFRQQVEARLGLSRPVNPAELAMAQTMDRLRAESPDATRSELRVSAQRLLQRTARPDPVFQ